MLGATLCPGETKLGLKGSCWRHKRCIGGAPRDGAICAPDVNPGKEAAWFLGSIAVFPWPGMAPGTQEETHGDVLNDW